VRPDVFLVHVAHWDVKGICRCLAQGAGLFDAIGVEIDMRVVAGDLCGVFHGLIMGDWQCCGQSNIHTQSLCNKKGGSEEPPSFKSVF